MIPLRKKRRIIDDVAQNILLSTLAVVAPAPFSQTEWPNPEPSRVQRQVSTDVPNLLGTTLAAPVPFSQVDWQNPTRARVEDASQPQANLLGTTLAVSANPFNQTDWPLVLAKARQQLVEELPNLIETVLATAHEIPPSQTDWPNPIMRRPLTPDFIGFMNPDDLAGPVVTVSPAAVRLQDAFGSPARILDAHGSAARIGT